MENKSFKVNGIKNLMKRNYDVSADLIDLEMEVDSSKTMAENWHNKIKRNVLSLTNKWWCRK